jgi:Na+/pantothenate symporter
VAILVTGVFLAGMIGALILWPDKFLLDIAIPTICFTSFAWWRDR